MCVPAVPEEVQHRYLPDWYISNAMATGPSHSFDSPSERVWCIITFGAASRCVQMQVVRFPANGARWCVEGCGVRTGRLVGSPS